MLTRVIRYIYPCNKAYIHLYSPPVVLKVVLDTVIDIWDLANVVLSIQHLQILHTATAEKDEEGKRVEGERRRREERNRGRKKIEEK